MSKTKNSKPKIAESSEEESDSTPLPSRTKPNKKLQLQHKKATKNQESVQSDREDSVPIVQKKIQPSLKIQKEAINRTVNPLKRVKKEQSSEQPSDSSEEKPQKKLIKIKSPIQAATIKKKAVKKQTSQEEQSEQQQLNKIVKGPTAKSTLTLKKTSKEEQNSSKDQARKKVTKVQSTFKTKSPLQKALVSNKKKEQFHKFEMEVRQSELEQDLKPTFLQKLGKAVQQTSESVLTNKKPTAEQSDKQIDQEGQFEVCVKGLSFYALQNDIEELFKPLGNLISLILLTRDDGKSKGIAFVKFSTKKSFNQALQLDGTQHLGRNITVEPSLSKHSLKSSNLKKDKQLQITVEITSPTIFVGGLSFATTQQKFSAFFQQAGKVISARIVTDKQTGKSKGFGYVQYPDVDNARKAYKDLNNKELDGKQLRIDNATQKDKPPGAKRGYQKIQLSQISNIVKQGSLASFRGRLEFK